MLTKDMFGTFNQQLEILKAAQRKAEQTNNLEMIAEFSKQIIDITVLISKWNTYKNKFDL